jgi:hypothetical protein
VSAGHRLGDKVATHLACGRCRDGVPDAFQPLPQQFEADDPWLPRTHRYRWVEIIEVNLKQARHAGEPFLCRDLKSPDAMPFFASVMPFDLGGKTATNVRKLNAITDFFVA